MKKYQEGLKEKIRESEFGLDSVDLLHYNLYKISLNGGGSYTDSSEWLKNKKATVNPKNNDDKCFQYAIAAALNYQNIKNNPERISNIQPFVEQYDWKEIDFASHKKDWKRFELNNKQLLLLTLSVITDGEKWHYLAVNTLSASVRGVASKHDKGFYCLNPFHSYSTKSKLLMYVKIMITVM